MKFLVLCTMLLGSGCAAKVTQTPASAPVVKTEKMSFAKFYVNYITDQQGNEKDCVYVDSKETDTAMHFLFACEGRLVHVGFKK